MILTCPACDTKYVVKDRAIPPQGRQVRCASCKHSWHQDPEAVEDAAAVGANSSEGTPEAGGPPEPPPFLSEQPAGEMPASAAIDAGVAGEPQPGGDMIARAG